MNSSKKVVKCISLDIDGTLLPTGHYSEKFISDQNIEALVHFCSVKSNKLVISTGRCLKDTIKIYNYLCQHGLSSREIPYLICLNGALIWNTSTEETIFQKVFDERLCRKMVDYLKRKKLDYFLINTENTISHSLNLFSVFLFKLIFRNRYTRRPLRLELDYSNIQRILVITKLPVVKSLRRKIKKEFGSDCYVSKCSSVCLEIMDSNIDKFYALRHVAERLCLEMEEIAAIGNDQNDVRSLENVGFGIGINLDLGWRGIQCNRDKIELTIKENTSSAVYRAIYEMKTLQLW